MHLRRPVARLGLALLVLVSAGCSGQKAPRPGATFEVAVITRGAGGKVESQGPATRVESAVTQDVRDITHEGATLSLLVRKTEYGQATFDVTFPDKTTQRVRVKNHQTKDVLPAGQNVGVRIQVQECH
jgi:hypothetical protein